MMQATSSYSSSATYLFPPLPPRGKKPHILAMAESNGCGRGSSNSNYKGRDFGGRLVDENMIVLRMRFQETKLLESNHKPPSEWMEWEQKYYQDYIQHVLQAMGLLQNYLMNLRPGFALGIIALITLTLLFSSGVAFFQALHTAAHMIISGFQYLS